MKEISVSGQKRATTGKKATKELRKEGLVPCNLYGEQKGEKGPRLSRLQSPQPSCVALCILPMFTWLTFQSMVRLIRPLSRSFSSIPQRML